jgi:hypothetical protein
MVPYRWRLYTKLTAAHCMESVGRAGLCSFHETRPCSGVRSSGWYSAILPIIRKLGRCALRTTTLWRSLRTAGRCAGGICREVDRARHQSSQQGHCAGRRNNCGRRSRNCRATVLNRPQRRLCGAQRRGRRAIRAAAGTQWGHSSPVPLVDATLPAFCRNVAGHSTKIRPQMWLKFVMATLWRFAVLMCLVSACFGVSFR